MEWSHCGAFGECDGALRRNVILLEVVMLNVGSFILVEPFGDIISEVSFNVVRKRKDQ